MERKWKFAGAAVYLSVFIILLMTSVELWAYWMPGYFEKEYEKYGVTEEVKMTMEDLLNVTDEMMAYLRGAREDLHVMTVVDGQEREFFNEREIAHMEDVRGLFLGGLWLRRLGIVILIGVLYWLWKEKVPFRKVLPKAFLTGIGVTAALLAVVAIFAAVDFTACFTIFHEIFFRNDLWLLDPNTDLLINIVPEGFFSDTALRIGLTFGGALFILLAASLFFWRKEKKGKGVSAK